MIKAIYGKVKLNRHKCPSCGNYLLNDERNYTCDVCDYKTEDGEAKRFKIIVPPPGFRKHPPMNIQKMLLKIQENKCYWCKREFGKPYWRNNRLKFLKINFDHRIPFSFEQTNRDNNWVASCNICNLFKSDFLFKEEKDCRQFIERKWEKALSKNIISFD